MIRYQLANVDGSKIFYREAGLKTVAVEASFSVFPERRDSAQPVLLQVGIPNFGKSHWVRVR